MIFHFVTWAYGPNREETVAETTAGTSFEATVADIWAGQHESVVRIVSFDTVTGTGLDVSKAVAAALAAKSHADADEPYYELVDFIEAFGFSPYRRPRTREEIREDMADDIRDLRIAA